MEKLKLCGTGERRFGKALLVWQEDGSLRVYLDYRGAYGLGERFDALNQKGRRVVCEVYEKFCFQGGSSYCPAPFFWTDSGFGLYADTCETTAFDFREGEIVCELPTGCGLTLFSGTPERMIAEYMSLFGPPVLPPDWVFGPWISANRWDSQADVENAVAEAERLGFPVSVVVIDEVLQRLLPGDEGCLEHIVQLIDLRAHASGLGVGQTAVDVHQNLTGLVQLLNHQVQVVSQNGKAAHNHQAGHGDAHGGERHESMEENTPEAFFQQVTQIIQLHLRFPPPRSRR